MQNIIAGNWKMFKNALETKEYFDSFLDGLTESNSEVRLYVPYLCLNEALKATKDSRVKIGAQNMHFEDQGAFTGEISAKMLKDAGVKYVLIGHSERRKYFGETDETVNLKLKKALEVGLIPTVCVGEDLAQREGGKAEDVLKAQVEKALSEVEDISKVSIAYEPVWAIGTGKTATDELANETICFIRKCVKALYGSVADVLPILYGGSVNTATIKGLMSMPDINGVLVGGASLKQDFVQIACFDK